MSNSTAVQRKKMSALCMCVAATMGLSACGSVAVREDPCAFANRDATFTVLLENSMANAYNACLEKKRTDIVQEWWKE
jgi:hypothetical protein